MADPRGFLKVARGRGQYRPVCERVTDFKEVAKLRPQKQSQEQALRCMDCATPFCHWACPIGNYIPEWNDYLFSGNWEKAARLLEATNNLAEITVRICPAVCEYSCVLALNNDAVTIRENELAVVELAFKKGVIKPQIPKTRTDKKIAVVGSGPAGLSAAAQLNRAGHKVVVFERDKELGGILRYGIPDFKLEKYLLDRRIDIWKKEGVIFKTDTNVGTRHALSLQKEFDAICLAGGARSPRDLKIPGRELKGIHFAMDYLVQANQRVAGEKISGNKIIDVKGKKVVIVGGGDTGSDCVGTANRQGATCVVQIEVLSRPPECRDQSCPWPGYPTLLKTSSSHQEGAQRKWSVSTKRFVGEKGRLKKLLCLHEGKEFEIDADVAILAVGFLHPEHSGLLKELKVSLDQRGNVKTDKNYMTSIKKVFSAGDMRRGQSLVVWAISEGRQCAYHIDRYLTGESNLPVI